MTPSDVRQLDWLERIALRRELRRPERRELAAFTVGLRGTRDAPSISELDWWTGIPGDSHHGEHWPDLPSGKRARQLERIRRVRLVMGARSELAAVLVRRIQALMPPLRPMPPHGRVCPPGCADCAAIQRWRAERDVLSGADATVHRYLYL